MPWNNSVLLQSMSRLRGVGRSEPTSVAQAEEHGCWTDALFSFVWEEQTLPKISCDPLIPDFGILPFFFF